MTSSVLQVFAGPNGSGKTTVTKWFPDVGSYVNADEIERHLGCTSLEAAKIATATREHLLSRGESFTFETLLSTIRNYDLMARAKAAGYKVICLYILTKDPAINVRRVEIRKNAGGHYVEPHDVIRRYHNAMALFPNLFDVCDECYVYDNSLDRGEGEPSMIIKYQYGDLEVYPNSVWSVEMLTDLCNGEYLKQ